MFQPGGLTGNILVNPLTPGQAPVELVIGA
jgi:hypothetical protein